MVLGYKGCVVSSFTELNELAGTGDNNAMYLLAKEYVKGEQVEADPVKYLEWLTQAAEAGNNRAMYVLAMVYQKGELVEADPFKYWEWLTKSAEAGNNMGMFVLARDYKAGKVVEADLAKYWEWLTKSANAGSDLAMYVLALSYRWDDVVETDLEKYMEWLTRSAEAGYSRAMYYLALAYEQGEVTEKDPDKYMEWQTKSAEAGNDKAMLYLALDYGLGEVVAEDSDKYLEWLTKSAEAGNNDAMYLLAAEYELGDIGEIVEPDLAKSWEWMIKSADAGNEKAVFEVGLNLLEGGKVEESINLFKNNQQSSSMLGLISVGFIELEKTGNWTKDDLVKLINALKNLSETVTDLKEKDHRIDIEKVTGSYEDVSIAHFTSFEAISNMLSNSEKEGGNQRNCLRLYNAAYMNDPLEGKALVQVCDGLKTFFDGVPFYNRHAFDWDGEEYSFYICSFTYNQADRLDLWRAYGTDGEGISLSMPLSAFRDEVDGNKVYESHIRTKKESLQLEDRETQGVIPKLYEVKYDKQSKENACKAIREPLDNLIEIYSEFDENNDNSREILSNLVRVILSDILYLYKNDEYKNEKEVRIITAQKMSEDNVKLDESLPTGRVYVETEPFLFKTPNTKLIIGPKLGESMDYFLGLKYKVEEAGFSKMTQVCFSKVPYR